MGECPCHIRVTREFKTFVFSYFVFFVRDWQGLNHLDTQTLNYCTSTIRFKVINQYDCFERICLVKDFRV